MSIPGPRMSYLSVYGCSDLQECFLKTMVFVSRPKNALLVLVWNSLVLVSKSTVLVSVSVVWFLLCRWSFTRGTVNLKLVNERIYFLITHSDKSMHLLLMLSPKTV